MNFSLIGRPTLIFKSDRLFYIAETIRCVHGVSLDGRLQTTARLADVNIVADVATTEIVEAAA